MRRFALALLVGLAMACPCGAGAKEDPKSVCLQLLGTYAEPDDPEDAEFTVRLVEGTFLVADCRGDKKPVEARATEEGLVFVGEDRDRDVFRLCYDAQKKEYYLEHLGKVRDDRPFPTKADFRARYVKIKSSPAGEGGAEAKEGEVGKRIVVDKTRFSDVYPAVWFSPSTGEIAPLKERSEVPPAKQYEIWIEPRDPEFGYNPDLKPKGVGFALLGKGDEVFRDPVIPEKPKLDLKLTHLMKESQGPDRLVFYCKGKACECLIMVTAMDSKEQVIGFRWRPLHREPQAGAGDRGRATAETG